MPLPLSIAVVIAAMVGAVAFALIRGPYRFRLLLFLIIALIAFVGEMIIFGVSG